MRTLLAALAAAFLLSACANPLKPYEPVPSTCTAIDAEMQKIAKEITGILAARTTKELAIAGIGVGVAFAVFPPAAAIAGPALSAISFDDVGRRRRLDYLANAKLHKGCE